MSSWPAHPALAVRLHELPEAIQRIVRKADACGWWTWGVPITPGGAPAAVRLVRPAAWLDRTGPRVGGEPPTEDEAVLRDLLEESAFEEAYLGKEAPTYHWYGSRTAAQFMYGPELLIRLLKTDHRTGVDACCRLVRAAYGPAIPMAVRNALQTAETWAANADPDKGPALAEECAVASRNSVGFYETARHAVNTVFDWTAAERLVPRLVDVLAVEDAANKRDVDARQIPAPLLGNHTAAIRVRGETWLKDLVCATTRLPKEIFTP